MIIFHVLYDKDKDYLGFSVKGHAGYADEGYDIICAAVSAVTQGMVNATELLTSANIIYEAADSGLLKFKFDTKPGHDEKLLFESMLLAIQDIEEQYGNEFLTVKYVQRLANGKYISIKNQEV